MEKHESTLFHYKSPLISLLRLMQAYQFGFLLKSISIIEKHLPETKHVLKRAEQTDTNLRGSRKLDMCHSVCFHCSFSVYYTAPSTATRARWTAFIFNALCALPSLVIVVKRSIVAAVAPWNSFLPAAVIDNRYFMRKISINVCWFCINLSTLTHNLKFTLPVIECVN